MWINIATINTIEIKHALHFPAHHNLLIFNHVYAAFILWRHKMVACEVGLLLNEHDAALPPPLSQKEPSPSSGWRCSNRCQAKTILDQSAFASLGPLSASCIQSSGPDTNYYYWCASARNIASTSERNKSKARQKGAIDSNKLRCIMLWFISKRKRESRETSSGNSSKVVGCQHNLPHELE